MEGDNCSHRVTLQNVHFQSTPSVWRETGEKVSGNEAFQISIHSLRMEGDFLFVRIQRYLIISIHSLRMEGD